MANREAQQLYTLFLDEQLPNHNYSFHFEPSENKPSNKSETSPRKNKISRSRIIIGTVLVAVATIAAIRDNTSHDENFALMTNSLPATIEPSPTLTFPQALPENTNGVIYIATPTVVKTQEVIKTPAPIPVPTPFLKHLG